MLDKLFGKVKGENEEKITRAAIVSSLETGLYPDIIEENEDETESFRVMPAVIPGSRYQIYVPKGYKYLEELNNLEDALYERMFLTPNREHLRR